MPPPSPTVPAATARRLLLYGQGLLGDPTRRVTPAVVHRLIERMGFVQVDSINVVLRAHHHILASRLDGYRPAMLQRLLETDRKVFEHWTHDASVIPVRWLPHWRHHFERYRRGEHGHARWWAKMLGPRPEQLLAHVRGRIEREGPLMSRDFKHETGGRAGSWWGWKPQKAALEYLWRTGDLAVSRRVNFQKVYDLTDRVFPHLNGEPHLDEADLRAWACTAALERLGFATPAEISRFKHAIESKAARSWCEAAVARGEVEEVNVQSADGSAPQRSFALAGWRRRAARAAAPSRRLTLLSPFDPVLRDRRRTQRLFGFDYRFEAFVPAAKRQFGYYVLPILEGDRLVGRLDPRLDREQGVLEVRGLWWEPGIPASRRRRSGLEAALGRLAATAGAETWLLPAEVHA